MAIYHEEVIIINHDELHNFFILCIVNDFVIKLISITETSKIYKLKIFRHNMINGKFIEIADLIYNELVIEIIIILI